MTARRLSAKLSLRNLKAKFSKDDSGSDYEEDHLIPRLRRASSRLSIRSETRENTRRNSQVSTTSSQGRQPDAGHNKSEIHIKLPFMSFTWSKSNAALAPAPDEEPSRARSRASTLAIDSEGHVQGHYDTAPPERRGYYPLNRPQHFVNVPPPRYVGRNDSVPQAEEEEEVEYEEYDEERHEVHRHEEHAAAARPCSPAGSAVSHDTIRRRAATPPPRPRAPSPHAQRCGHEDSERDVGDRRDDGNRRPCSSISNAEGRSSRIGHTPDRRASQRSQHPPNIGRSARHPSYHPPNLDIHPAFRYPNSTLNVSRALREPGVESRTDAESSMDPHRPDASSPLSPSPIPSSRTTSQQAPNPPTPQPRFMGLRRQRGIHFHEPERPRRESVGQSWSAYERPLSPRSDSQRQGSSLPQPPIPEQEFDKSRLLWTVGSEICRRAEREEIWRATTPNQDGNEGEKEGERKREKEGE